MRLNKTFLIAILVMMGLLFQWLQKAGRETHITGNIESNLKMYLENHEPIVRNAKEQANAIFANVKETVKSQYHKISGRLIGQEDSETLRGEHSFTEGQPAKEEAEKEIVGYDDDGNPIYAEKSAEEQEIVGYDEDGNPIYAAKEKKDGEEEGEQELIGYDENGNPIYADKDESVGADGDESDDEENPDEEEVADNKTPEETPKKDEDKKEEAKDESDGAGVVAGFGGGTPPQDQQKNGVSKDEWVQRILVKPDFEVVTELITAYQGGQVSKEDFYAIVDEMLKDQRPAMKNLGAMALGMTPSVDSFLKIADLNQTLDYGSAMRGDLDAYLAQYSTLSYLPVIEQIMMNPPEGTKTHTLILATQRLDIAARNYMSKEPPSEPDPADPNVHQLSDTQRRFKRFVDVLEKFISRNSDPEAVSTAQQTLNSINSLLIAGNSMGTPKM